LDLYRGQFDFVNFSTQVHDFNPGITPYPDGLFWTVPLTDGGVDVQFGAGKASMRATDLQVRDFFSIPNSLFRFLSPASVAATCSFDIEWKGPVTDRSKVNDPVVGFEGDFVSDQATMTWSASRADGFRFQSDPHNTTSVFAELGKMKNGVFFSHDKD
jgi:hypothetical protein